jgi:hypothetical protein
MKKWSQMSHREKADFFGDLAFFAGLSSVIFMIWAVALWIAVVMK